MKLKTPSIARRNDRDNPDREQKDFHPGAAKRGNANDSSPLLTGIQAFLTLENPGSGESYEGMRRVAVRRTSLPIKRSYYSGKSKQLAVYVDESAVESFKDVRLACDAYLRLGLWRSLKLNGRPLIILGGDGNEDGVNVEVLVFKSGEVVHVGENSLPRQAELDFDDMLSSLLDNLISTYPGCVIEQCPNLPDLNSEHISRVHSDDLFKRLKKVSLDTSSSYMRHALLPASVVIACAGFYAYSLIFGHLQFADLRNQAHELESRVSQLSGIDASIEVMEARESFKHRELPEEVEYVDTLREIAGAVALLGNAEVLSLRVPGAQADVAAYLSLKAERDSSPVLLQARSLLDELVGYIEGYSMRLSQSQGVATREGDLVFHIEVING